MVGKPAGEECGRLHIHSHGTCGAQVLLEALVILPHAAVGGIYGTRPVVHPQVADGARHGTLQHEGRQRRHLGRKVVVACSLATYSGYGQYQVALLSLAAYAPALAQKEAGLGTDGTQEIHDDGGIGTAHAKVDDADAVGRGSTHVRRIVGLLHSEFLTEDIHIIVEVGEQDILAEVLQRMFGVSGQPVLHYFLFRLHNFLNCLFNEQS